MDKDTDAGAPPARNGDAPPPPAPAPPQAVRTDGEPPLPQDDPATGPPAPPQDGRPDRALPEGEQAGRADQIPPPAASSTALDGPVQAFIVGGGYGMLALLGLLMGFVGALHYRWSVGPVPLAALALVALNFGVLRLAGWGMRGKIGAAVPWVTWMAVVIAASSRRAEGDLLITGDLSGYLFIIGGMVGGGLAVALTRSPGGAGSWLLGPGVRDRT